MELWVTVAPSNSQQFQHLFVQYFHNIYTICAQYMHNICKIYVQVLHNIFIIFVHYLRNICIMYAQYLYNICTIYVLGRLPSQLSMHKFVLVVSEVRGSKAMGFCSGTLKVRLRCMFWWQYLHAHRASMPVGFIVGSRIWERLPYLLQNVANHS